MVRHKVKPQPLNRGYDKQPHSQQSHEIIICDDETVDNKAIPSIKQSSHTVSKISKISKSSKKKLFTELTNSSIASFKINSNIPSDKPIHCLLGELQIEVLKCDLKSSLNSPVLWLFLKDGNNESILYFNSQIEGEAEIPDREISSFISGKLDIDLWISLSFIRYTCVAVNSYDENTLKINVYLLASALIDLSSPAEINSGLKSLAPLFWYFYKIPIPNMNVEISKYIDAESLYRSIQQTHKGKSYWSANVQHPNLIPTLRPYQKLAVKWMLFKETKFEENLDVNLHPLYIEVEAVDGTTIYYNKYWGFCVKEKPLFINPSLGGILADEMGLGKTVEILACILNHPRSVTEGPTLLTSKQVFDFDSCMKPEIFNNKRVYHEQVVEDTTEDSLHKSVGDINSLNHSSEKTVELVNPFDTLKIITHSTTVAGSMLMDEDQEENTNEASFEGVRSRRENSACGCIEIIDEYEFFNDNPNANCYAEFSKKGDYMKSSPETADEQIMETPQISIKQMDVSYLAKDEGSEEKNNISNSRRKNKRLTSDKLYYESFKNSYEEESNKNNVPILLDGPRKRKISRKYFGDNPTNADDQNFIIAPEFFDGKRKSKRQRLKKSCNEESFDENRSTCESSDVNYDRSYCNEDIVLKHKVIMDTFDPEKEILINPVKSVIEKVILDKVWNNSLSNYKKEGSHKAYRKFLKMRKRDPTYLMTIKESLNLQYLNSISHYSATYALKPGAMIKDFFEVKVKQKSFFECVCGNNAVEIEDGLIRIQCSMCKLLQHASCVHYDATISKIEEYICPHCWSEQGPVTSGATLIVSPSSISYQWEEEIRKHLKVESLKLLIYNGVSTHGYLQPKKLASYDIVLTTYEVLKRELNYVDLPHCNSEAGRRFRHPKRFMAIPSPLPCVNWWRICLDEAQMVECATTKTAEMCHRLKGHNKWCVTGTPIQKSINDLQGLLMFLKVDPYGFMPWWQRCLYNPYCLGETEPLLKLMGRFMWRTSKKDVLDQLGIPLSIDKFHWLCFNPVEEHFYKRLHSQYSSEVTIKLNRFPQKSVALTSLDRQTLSSLLQPLLKLRQACNHPQIVKGQFTPLARKTLTMEQILENLIRKTQLEAEEAHRLILASLNGLAALCIIRKDFDGAITLYREAIRAMEEDGKYLKTDLLQKLHTIHNMSELLLAHETIEPTLRDENLANEAVALREQYLKQYPKKIDDAMKDCIEQTRIITNLKNQITFHSDWWLNALEAVNQEFVLEIREELLAQYSRFQEHKCILHSVHSRVQLLRLLQFELKKLEIQREDMITAIQSLYSVKDYSILLNGAVDCHLRPSDISPSKCELCVKHELFEIFEETLFFVKDEKINRCTDTSKEIMENVESLYSLKKGNWGMSDIERILKYVQTKLLGRVDLNILEDSQTHIEILQHMKKEFKHYRIWWRSIYDYVSALDEVNMATLRYRLKLPDEAIPSTWKKNQLEKKQTEAPKYIFEECELPQMDLKLNSDIIINKNDLTAKLGQIFYLNNLKKSDLGRKGSCNPEPCPVCKSKLGEKWAVLQCGHCYCIECIGVFLKFSSPSHKKSVKCPMCRRSTMTREISYIDTQGIDTEDTIRVNGSFSTKVEGVVRLVLKVKIAEPDAKILVFSSWIEVLDLISEAFAANGITFRLLKNRHKFQANLSSFKSKQEIMVLLLPLSFGANGLNLVEAQHVILVEPVLNPASEEQAIGRIHRIGQTKTTVIHRFIVHSTIEERMHRVLSPKENLVHDQLITIENLQELFARVEVGNAAECLVQIGSLLD